MEQEWDAFVVDKEDAHVRYVESFLTRADGDDVAGAQECFGCFGYAGCLYDGVAVAAVATFGIFHPGEGGGIGESGVELAVCGHEIYCLDFVGGEFAVARCFGEVAAMAVVDNPVADVM